MGNYEGLKASIDLIIGKELTRLKRTVGSSFFIDIGEISSDNTTVGHGEYYFLITSDMWRIRKCGAVILSSMSDITEIDSAFPSIVGDTISSVDTDLETFDLRLQLTSGIIIDVFVSYNDEQIDDTWTFYAELGKIWSVCEGPAIAFEEDKK